MTGVILWCIKNKKLAMLWHKKSTYRKLTGSIDGEKNIKSK